MVSYDYYRIFYYVGSCRSFTQAARMLGSNQPNVSRAMNSLEAELGCKLMHRGKRGITLTQVGQKLYEHVIEHHHVRINPTKTVLYGLCEACLAKRGE